MLFNGWTAVRLQGPKGIVKVPIQGRTSMNDLFVTREAPNAEPEERARVLRGLKPHIPQRDALMAVREIDDISSEAESIAA